MSDLPVMVGMSVHMSGVHVRLVRLHRCAHLVHVVATAHACNVKDTHVVNLSVTQNTMYKVIKQPMYIVYVN